MNKPIMARATAVWLIDNTTLSFKQIADFVGMHELEIQGIADGDVAVGVKGFDPVSNSQLDAHEIAQGEKDPLYKLRLKFNPAAIGEEKRRGPRYTPLSKRQDRPAAILWLVKFHPELSDGVIGKLVPETIRFSREWRIMSADEKCVVGLMRGGGTATNGHDYTQTYCQIMTIRDGLIVELHEFFDTALVELALNDNPTVKGPSVPPKPFQF
mgnify:CR=1 FL=1